MGDSHADSQAAAHHHLAHRTRVACARWYMPTHSAAIKRQLAALAFIHTAQQFSNLNASR